MAIFARLPPWIHCFHRARSTANSNSKTLVFGDVKICCGNSNGISTAKQFSTGPLHSGIREARKPYSSAVAAAIIRMMTSSRIASLSQSRVELPVVCRSDVRFLCVSWASCSSRRCCSCSVSARRLLWWTDDRRTDGHGSGSDRMPSPPLRACSLPWASNASGLMERLPVELRGDWSGVTSRYFRLCVASRCVLTPQSSLGDATYTTQNVSKALLLFC